MLKMIGELGACLVLLCLLGCDNSCREKLRTIISRSSSHTNFKLEAFNRYAAYDKNRYASAFISLFPILKIFFLCICFAMTLRPIV